MWNGKPKRAYFTHICHDLPHERTEQRLPPHVRLAYDGLEIHVDGREAASATCDFTRVSMKSRPGSAHAR